jgi:hypothetical protein
MGWLTFHETRTAKQYFTDMINDCKGIELVDIAIVNFRTAYIAIKDIEKGYTYCLVYLLHRAPNSYHNFGYKDMSEFSGPCVDDCPERILIKLSPLELIGKHEPDWDIEYAQRWRESVRNRIKQNDVLKEATKKGYILKTKQPVSFTNGYYIQYFIKEGAKVFGLYNYGEPNEYKMQVRFRGLKSMDFEVIKK